MKPRHDATGGCAPGSSAAAWRGAGATAKNGGSMDYASPLAPPPADADQTAAAPQRARGELRIAYGVRDGRTVLRDLYQSGCLKARFPRPEPAARPTAVLLNTGGGVAGGDALRVAIQVAAGARLVVTTQAAERVYRARPADRPARIDTTLQVADGAQLDWLPQETILFDRARARRRLEVELGATAGFVGVESLVLGRRAMGEQVTLAWWRDLIRLRRAGRLLLHDAVRLEGAVTENLAGAATGGGARAVATLLYVGPDAAARLDPLRARLAAAGAGASATGASTWEGLLLARIVAADSARLRRLVVAGLAVLRDDHPLPRLWHS
jgi:urease accessory protein